MCCEQNIYLLAPRRKEACPHPAITCCASCRIGLCSAHIVECEDCQKIFCRECPCVHQRKGLQRVTRAELERVVVRAKFIQ